MKKHSNFLILFAPVSYLLLASDNKLLDEYAFYMDAFYESMKLRSQRLNLVLHRKPTQRSVNIY